MQAKNEEFANKGLIRSFTDIARKEGIPGLWRVRAVCGVVWCGAVCGVGDFGRLNRELFLAIILSHYS